MATQTDIFSFLNTDGDNKHAIHRKDVDRNGASALEGVLPDLLGETGGERDSSENNAGSSERNDAGNETVNRVRLHRAAGVGDDEGRIHPEAGRAGADQGERGGLGGMPGTRSDERDTENRGRGIRLEEVELGAGGKKEKFRTNLNAIRALRDIDERNGFATEGEKKKLAKYVGWGGLQEAFRRHDGTTAQGWNREAYELEALLSENEYKAARLSTTDAHYTSKEVVTAMWKSVRAMGFAGGKVLEPSCGIGNFIGLMPESVIHNSTIHAVELDDLTGRMIEKLYPTAHIHKHGFEESQLFDPSPGSYDLVITNPPFGSQRVHDELHTKDSSHSIHNYFVLKSLTATRANGVVAMVISRYFLDSKTSTAREAVADRAEFLGAVRLPNTAFLQNAGTEVTSDIVFFRKYASTEGEEIRKSSSARRWIDIVDVDDANPESDEDIAVNAYFADNPNMLLGQWGSFGSTIHGVQGALIPHSNQNTAELLNTALAKLPSGFMPRRQQVLLGEDDVEGITSAQIGAIFLSNDRIYFRAANIDGIAKATPIALKPRDFARALAFIALRDALTNLIKAELNAISDTGSESNIESWRKLMSLKYDQFVARFGHIQSRTNKRLFRVDPAWSKVAGLEIQTAGETSRSAPIITKAAILTERTLFPQRPPENVDNALDALAASLASKGGVDLAFMTTLYSQPKDNIIAELGDRVFDVGEEKYEIAQEFLSGDVKRKLTKMEGLAAHDYRFERNVIALKRVIPRDIPASKINIKVGAHWLPEDVMSDFVDQICGDPDAQATYNKALAKWVIVTRTAHQNNIQWGTPRRKAKDLLLSAIAQKSANVYDHDDDNKRILNIAATAAANVKVAKIKDEFAGWVFNDPDQKDRLARLYNDTFNTHVDCIYDGSHLTFPGKIDDTAIKLQQHQTDAVWRIISAGKPTLLHHVVGAGKTYTMIATAMEMRRLGKASKPMIVVPNHLIKQWESEFNKLYPGAQILVPEKKDFSKENRELLFARIANGNWDSVIIAHSSFDRIRISPEAEIKFLEEQVRELEMSRTQLELLDGKNASVKEIARREKAIESKLMKLMSIPRDGGYAFNELGIDALFVDESHEYKNLMYVTSINRVAGIGNPVGSKKAYHMLIKSRHVLDVSGGNLIFASGTPISNSIPEMFTLQRYLDKERIESLGLEHFDAWARMFGEITYEYELTPTQTYREVSRFSKFANLPELIRGYKVFADVISREDIEESRAKLGLLSELPAVAGGKPMPVIAVRSPEQANAIDDLVLRADTLELPDNMLAVMTDARKIALDMRIHHAGNTDFHGSKINLAADNIAQIYNQTAEVKGVQLVFLDMSTPKSPTVMTEIRRLSAAAEVGDSAAQNELDKLSREEIATAFDKSTFSVYDDLREKLIGRGVDDANIAFIHDANTDDRKSHLFDKVNQGDIRVLFGSTSRLGPGTNVQQRLVALHHLDCPWRPSDVEQREGRILRRGNLLYAANPENFSVQIFRYATKQTLDSRMWQTIECKATFIKQILDLVDSGEREIDDGINEAQMAAIMKAEASGDPRLLEDIEFSSKINKMELDRKAWLEEQREIGHQIQKNDLIINSTPPEIVQMEDDLRLGEKAPTGENFTITIDKKVMTSRKDAGVALIAIHKSRVGEYGLNGNHHDRKANDELIIGEYVGFRLSMSLESIFAGAGVHRICMCSTAMVHKVASLVTSDASPVGLASSIHATVTKSLKSHIDVKKQEMDETIVINKGLLEQQQPPGSKWPHESELENLKQKSIRLKKAIARDAEKVKTELRQKREDTTKTVDFGIGD